jgi:hypothetical protein
MFTELRKNETGSFIVLGFFTKVKETLTTITDRLQQDRIGVLECVL